jgi:pimeloyl-ACP methyl ester carboxylesterase
MYTHRAFRQLTSRLTRYGFHVLRFDYYGFGDSYGDSEESNIDQWVDDVNAAIDEVKKISRMHRISLVGLRLGATAAALAASGRKDIDNIVLWEPILVGSKYLDELSVLHENWLSEFIPGKPEKIQDYRSSEILGMPFTPQMKEKLEKINLMKISCRLAENVLILENSQNGIGDPDTTFFKGWGARIDQRTIGKVDAWSGNAGMETVMVPGEVLNLIVSWISEVAS